MFSVTDGREGFPAKFLEEPPEEGMALRIVDGELMARGRNAMISYDRQKPLGQQSNGWVATGDLVGVHGDRVVFTGRRNDVINVGGRKVSPLQVEATLRSFPGIIDVRVYAKKSSLTGNLVAADVVLAPGVCEETIGAELRQAASRTLQPHEVPRIVRIVPKMAINEALKIVRSEQAE
jgi:acyl-coenzyme A synthetase/AMP-(fatty) acid ligase